MFHEVWQLERFQSAKVTFEVIRTAVPFDKLHTISYISLPLPLCLYRAPLTRYYQLCPTV